MSSLSESERQRHIQVLKLILKDLDRPVRQPYPRIDTEREEAAKDEARAAGRELLTPLAACRLFNKSAPTVRRAVSEGRVWAPFTLNATGKSMALISCLQPVTGRNSLLTTWRSCGTTAKRWASKGLSITS